MANITDELQAIMDAVYGEEVRGSIHDAIERINDVSEKSIDIGTDVTSSTSSIEGYYEDSLYVNSQTYDLWRCTGTAWVYVGNLKGDAGNAGAWVFETEDEWNAFDKSRINNNDTIMFLWDRTSSGESNYMMVEDFVGSSATGVVNSATNSTKLNNQPSSYYAKSNDLGTLKFRINGGNAQYSKDNGGSWSNFRNPIGTANVGNVLVGKTFANSENDSLFGSMPNNGAFVGEITEKDGTIAIPEGYHNGSGYVSATYDSNISYCFKIGSLGAVESGTIDVSVACADISSDYGITIDPATLTIDNFVVSTKANTSGAYTPVSNSSYIGGLSVGSRVKAQFYGHTLSYSNNILTVNNSKVYADAYVTVSDGGSVGYCNSGWIYASSDIYLIMIPA